MKFGDSFFLILKIKPKIAFLFHINLKYPVVKIIYNLYISKSFIGKMFELKRIKKNNSNKPLLTSLMGSVLTTNWTQV